jgi:SRSO17 transposase
MDRLVEVMAAKLAPSPGVLVLDDTALPKKGAHSVGVARQYCGALGKVSNCQSVVSWHFAGADVHFPLVAELYLPKEWTTDPSRMAKAGVPKRRTAFVTKWSLALSLLDRIKGKIPYEAILFDAGYGEVKQLLSALDKRGEFFIGRIPESHSFWANDTEMITASQSNRGRPRKHPVVADRRERTLSAKRWTQKLLADGRSFKTVKLPLGYKPSAEVLAVRVHEWGLAGVLPPGPARWLLIERLGEDSFKYYLQLPRRERRCKG